MALHSSTAAPQPRSPSGRGHGTDTGSRSRETGAPWRQCIATLGTNPPEHAKKRHNQRRNLQRHGGSGTIHPYLGIAYGVRCALVTHGFRDARGTMICCWSRILHWLTSAAVPRVDAQPPGTLLTSPRLLQRFSKCRIVCVYATAVNGVSAMYGRLYSTPSCTVAQALQLLPSL